MPSKAEKVETEKVSYSQPMNGLLATSAWIL
jgi:hypothetical protein